MFVACSTLCFARQSLAEALRQIGDLEFSKVDVAIHAQGPHLKPSEVADDVQRAAQMLKSGPSLAPAAFSVDIDATEPDEFDRQLRGVCRLGRLCSVAVLSMPAAPVGQGIDAEVNRLTRLVNLVQKEGVVLTVETRVGTLTENPDTAVELCERVPGLGLTLDPSHYIAGPNAGKNYDQVFPFVYHVHLRDTGRGPGQFQVRVGQGEVEYGRIINQLVRYNYDRLLTVQIFDHPDASCNMEHEVRKLKYLLESLV
ncbi:MAG: sugar phosphate isomerase/epimerase family protein [Gemmataceae bacterium]